MSSGPHATGDVTSQAVCADAPMLRCHVSLVYFHVEHCFTGVFFHVNEADDDINHR